MTKDKPKLDLDKIYQEYKNGLSCNDLDKKYINNKYNCRIHYIYYELKNHGYKLRTKAEANKHSVKMGKMKHLKGNYGSKNNNWKGGEIKTDKGRTFVLVGNGKYIAKAIIVWERYYKQRKPDGYVIHHIDLDPSNDDIKNLKCMSWSKHASFHNKLRPLRKLIVGFDNGLNGGIVAINSKFTIYRKFVIPTSNINNKKNYNIKELINIFKQLKIYSNSDMIVMLEQAHVRPISGKRACFSTGFGYGIIQGILNSLNIKYEIITPQKWMKDILKGIDTKDKKASIIFCKRKWPKEDWRATERCTKMHDGLTDAACLSLYGLRLYGYKQND